MRAVAAYRAPDDSPSTHLEELRALGDVLALTPRDTKAVAAARDRLCAAMGEQAFAEVGAV